MTDDDNPYRFAGKPEPGSPPLFRAAEADAMRRVALYRHLLIPATIVHYGGWLLMVIASDPLPGIDEDYVFAFGAACLFPLVIGGAIAMRWLSPRFVFFKAVSLLVPLLNIAVVAYVLRDARRRLEDQGLRLGQSDAARPQGGSDPAGDQARSE